MNFEIGPMYPSDWAEVRKIYEEGIASDNATFETIAPDWDEWDKKHHREGRVVSRLDNTVVGWAALSPVSERCVYAGVAELSIYVSPEYQGRSIGTSMLRELIGISETSGIWTLQSGIFPENEGCIRMHLKCGFRQVGIRKKLGQLSGRWRDVLLFERRSERPEFL